MPKSVLRIKESKQPIAPEKRGDGQWCTYCNRLIKKSIFEEHQRERHNVDLEADKKQKKPKILVKIVVRRTRQKKSPGPQPIASTPAIRLSPEIRNRRSFRKKTSRRFSNSSFSPKLNPQSPRKPQGQRCAICKRTFPHAEFAKHNCNPPKNPVEVRKLSSLPRKQKYVKVKKDFQTKLSDASGGWY